MELELVRQYVTVYGPATVANLRPGFDWPGRAVEVSTALTALLSDIAASC